MNPSPMAHFIVVHWVSQIEVMVSRAPIIVITITITIKNIYDLLSVCRHCDKHRHPDGFPVKIWDKPNSSSEITNVNISLPRANMVPKLSLECVSSQILDDTMLSFNWLGTHQVSWWRLKKINHLVCMLVSAFALFRENTDVNIRNFPL